MGLTPYVLDASAGVELLLRTKAGTDLEAKLPSRRVWWVPEHYYLEVANVLRRIERLGIHSPQRVGAAFGTLCTNDILKATLRPLLVAAWVRRGHLTIGDAFYVALAEAVGATLVTADLKLASSPHLPVPVITP